jgi:diguanylate cyclase (GGDEF)-like protein
VSSIASAPDGTNINAGFGATAPARLAERVLAEQADGGLALDGDADRAILVDETGKVLDGDDILLAWARQLAADDRLPHHRVVATVMSNFGLERALRRDGVDLRRCAVGDRWVWQAMRQHEAALGGEQSGHVICAHGEHRGWPPDRRPRARGAQEWTAAQALAEWPRFPQVLINVGAGAPLEGCRRCRRRCASWRNGSVGWPRSSVTPAPLLRILVEAASAEDAREAADRLAVLAPAARCGVTGRRRPAARADRRRMKVSSSTRAIARNAVPRWRRRQRRCCSCRSSRRVSPHGFPAPLLCPAGRRGTAALFRRSRAFYAVVVLTVAERVWRFGADLGFGLHPARLAFHATASAAARPCADRAWRERGLLGAIGLTRSGCSSSRRRWFPCWLAYIGCDQRLRAAVDPVRSVRVRPGRAGGASSPRGRGPARAARTAGGARGRAGRALASLAPWWRTAEEAGTLLFGAATAVMIAGPIRGDFSAYRDQLTGLPGRRAFDEELNGRRFTIALVDIDHFGEFNDRWDTDFTRCCAGRSRLAVGGGGRAFRHGGEEFAVLFPAVALKVAEAHLEKVRASIAAAGFTVRGADRPARKPATVKRSARGQPHLTVTVSIGVAERDARHDRAEAVVTAADAALYRAKAAGRNRLSR